MKEIKNWINNEPVTPTSGETLENINPAKNEVLSKIPRSGKKDVDLAVAAAKTAFPTWSRTSVEERAQFCEKIADEIEKRIDTLAELESLDTGKPLQAAKMVDIPRAVWNFRFFAQAIRQDFERTHAMRGAHNYSYRSPAGVAALITPWNLPLYLLTWKVAPAIAAGNTVVAKPSEMSPSTANALAEIISKVGVPKGVFNLLHGIGPEVGQELVAHPDVRLVSFTGGTASGATVAKTAATDFKKLSLELGGKNPTIVFDDCDFSKTVQGVARAAFTNQGQVCLCGSRVFIQKGIYQKFTEALIEETKSWTVGDPSQKESRLGSLISLAHREKVEGYLDLAKKEGGKILSGGKRPKLSPPFDSGAFLEPTIISDLSFECRTAQEEIFGPVVTLHPFETEAEVLKMANSVKYGLAASVWTENARRAHRISQELETGMVWVNTWLLRDLRVPFGGVKASGIGTEGGHYSLDFYSETKNICIDLGDPVHG